MSNLEQHVATQESAKKKKALQKIETPTPGALIQFDESTIALIKAQIAPKATDKELELFLYQCKRTGLDPLTRQIYAIHRGDKMTIQTSIDGFRVIASRSGSYAGQHAPRFYYNDKQALERAEVDILKFNPVTGEPYVTAVGVAFWREYVQSGNMWVKYPHVMLSKVAEALALRKAFPQDLSGLYTDDEIADNQEAALRFDVENKAAQAPPRPTKIDTRKEAAGTFADTAQDVTAEVTTAPAGTGLTPEVWQYCEARKTILNMLLTYSIFEPGTEDYINIFSYVKETAGKKMSKTIYDKIKANLLAKIKAPQNPKTVKAEISNALVNKGLTNPDAVPAAK